MYQLVGKERIDYISKKTGKRVVGGKVYLLIESTRVEGYKTEDVYVSVDTYNRFFADIPLESFLDLYFDRNGFVVGCSIISNESEVNV